MAFSKETSERFGLLLLCSKNADVKKKLMIKKKCVHEHVLIQTEHTFSSANTRTFLYVKEQLETFVRG